MIFLNILSSNSNVCLWITIYFQLVLPTVALLTLVNTIYRDYFSSRNSEK